MPAARAAGREDLVVLAPEAAAVASVRVQRAERDPRLLDAEPVAESARVIAPRSAIAAGVTDAGTSRRAMCVVASTTRSGVPPGPRPAASTRASSPSWRR
jgi:hypothetical protein